MSWNSEPKRSTLELTRMSYVRQRALSWQEASEFIADDTLQLAEWHRCQRLDALPYHALLRMPQIKGELEILGAPAFHAQQERVGAAFGIEKWESSKPYYGNMVLTGQSTWDASISCEIDRDGRIEEIEVFKGFGLPSCTVNHDMRHFCPVIAHRNPQNVCEVMARGLYRLGYSNSSVLDQLNHPLTAHEKLELRDSLPRQFWPKVWLEEKEN